MIRNGTQLDTYPRQEQRKIHFPDTLTIGTSYRFNDRLTVALDVSRTDWNDLYVESANGTRFSLIDGAQMNMLMPDDPEPTDFDATMTIRLGAEYVLTPQTTGTDLNRLWSLRGGVFFDQEPASGTLTASGEPPKDGSPDNFYGFSAGVGLLAFQRFNFDVAYQLRYGNNVNSDFIGGVRHFDEDVLQHRLIVSTVLYF